MAMRIQIDPLVRSVVQQEGAVLLHLGNGRYQSLNGTGAIIWNELYAGASTTEIVSRLCSRFAATQQEIETDLTEFIAQLERRGLISTVNEP